MTKAEQAALEAYPHHTAENLDDVIKARKFFAKGYEQAEKDLALTWEDMQRIVEIYYTLHDSYKGNSNIYNEVLRRFNKSKEEKQ